MSLKDLQDTKAIVNASYYKFPIPKKIEVRKKESTMYYVYAMVTGIIESNVIEVYLYISILHLNTDLFSYLQIK